MNKHLQHYFVAVQHPEVSGFEMLDMLMIRDKLANQYEALTTEERQRLSATDRQLVLHAAQFNTELSQVTELSSERERRMPAPEQWWWFLDVLATMPINAMIVDGSVVAA
ncbi:MAG: hypothetical protein R3C14_52370 [Caldilineaceae bacterium]